MKRKLEKNYEDFIKSLIDEDVFRIITDVRYFQG